MSRVPYAKYLNAQGIDPKEYHNTQILLDGLGISFCWDNKRENFLIQYLKDDELTKFRISIDNAKRIIEEPKLLIKKFKQ